MAMAVSLLTFVNLLQNLSNHRCGHSATVRFHPHVALVKGSKGVLRFFRGDITGKPRCRSLLIFRPPPGSAGFASHRYGIQAGGMRRSGRSMDRVDHSRAKLRHRFWGKIECSLLAHIISSNDSAVDRLHLLDQPRLIKDATVGD